MNICPYTSLLQSHWQCYLLEWTVVDWAREGISRQFTYSKSPHIIIIIILISLLFLYVYIASVLLARSLHQSICVNNNNEKKLNMKAISSLCTLKKHCVETSVVKLHNKWQWVNTGLKWPQFHKLLSYVPAQQFKASSFTSGFIDPKPLTSWNNRSR